MRIAVVDVGTNTTRLYIAELADTQSTTAPADAQSTTALTAAQSTTEFTDAQSATELAGAHVTAELTRISRVTRLGAGVDASGRLADDALKREYAVLDEYQQLIQAAAPQRALAVMTSAVRDAANGGGFADNVAARYGLEVHVLSGEEEAQLTYRGATDGLEPDPEGAPTLVFDIGGGSTELVIGHGERVDFHVSTQAGVVRQADRHISSDPPTVAQLAALAEDVRALLQESVPEQFRLHPGRALGVAGTPTSLAAIAQELEPYDPARVHGYQLSAAQRDSIYRRLVALPLAQRRQVRGLHPDRALAILPGIVILTAIMRLFGLAAIEVSEHDILRGAALHYAGA